MGYGIVRIQLMSSMMGSVFLPVSGAVLQDLLWVTFIGDGLLVDGMEPGTARVHEEIVDTH